MEGDSNNGDAEPSRSRQQLRRIGRLSTVLVAEAAERAGVVRADAQQDLCCRVVASQLYQLGGSVKGGQINASHRRMPDLQQDTQI